MEEDDYTDAEFTVVKHPRRRRLAVDWRAFAIIAGIAAIGLVRALGGL